MVEEQLLDEPSLRRGRRGRRQAGVHALQDLGDSSGRGLSPLVTALSISRFCISCASTVFLLALQRVPDLPLADAVLRSELAGGDGVVGGFFVSIPFDGRSWMTC